MYLQNHLHIYIHYNCEKTCFTIKAAETSMKLPATGHMHMLLSVVFASAMCDLHAVLVAEAHHNWIHLGPSFSDVVADHNVLVRSAILTRKHKTLMGRRITKLLRPRVHIDVPGLPRSVSWQQWKIIQGGLDANGISYDLRINGKKLGAGANPECALAVIRLSLYGLLGGMPAAEPLDDIDFSTLSKEKLEALAKERGIPRTINKRYKNKAELIADLHAALSTASSSSVGAGQPDVIAECMDENIKGSKRLQDRERKKRAYHESGGKEAAAKRYQEGGQEVRDKRYQERE